MSTGKNFLPITVIAVVWCFASAARANAPAFTAAALSASALSEAVFARWPAGTATIPPRKGGAIEEDSLLLEAISSQWQTTANGKDFAYIKAAVDGWVQEKGQLQPRPEQSILASAPGSAILLCYRVTGEARYAQAAQALLAQQPMPTEATGAGAGAAPFGEEQGRQPSIDRDAALSAMPFRAAYARTFQQRSALEKTARQLLSMEKDPATSRNAQPAEAEWSRQNRYALALIDTLPWLSQEHAGSAQLVVALGRWAEIAARRQDPGTGLWWEARGVGGNSQDLLAASNNALLVYALAKGVRLGYLPQQYESVAARGWRGVERQFLALHQKPGQRDPLNGTSPALMGAYLLAESEMQQAATENLAQGKRVVVDAWFNSQTRQTALGQTELFHYKWDDDQNSGFAFFGRAFQRFGARLSELTEAPTAAKLAGASVYVLASPDTPGKNPHPHYMDMASGEAIEAWVRGGGVLLLMENDKLNSEFEHFNTMSERFGIHFSPVVRNTVEGQHFEQGLLNIPAGAGGVFPRALTVYMKDICTIRTSGPAHPIFTDKGDTLMAVAKVGKGSVYAVVDPWLYNEYTDGRKLPTPPYQDFAAAIDLARWALRVAR